MSNIYKTTETGKKVRYSKLCIGCKEAKIHPAFERDQLCSTCASDGFENYQQIVAEFKATRKNK
jgi:hypothetical protein